MQKTIAWRAKKGRSLLAAAAFSLSILFCSHQQLAHYTPPSASNTPTEINLVQRTPSVRGGETASKPKQLLLKTEEKIEEAVYSATGATSRTLKEAINDLADFMKGPKSDTLLLLLATALITPICQRLGTSPILGLFWPRECC